MDMVQISKRMMFLKYPNLHATSVTLNRLLIYLAQRRFTFLYRCGAILLTSVTAVKTLIIPEDMNAASAASDMTSKQGGTVDVSPP